MAGSTKQDIVNTLGVFLKEKRLDEITVKDLTERCGISRQAFYYHFSDLYEVVRWGVEQEIRRLITVAMDHAGDADRERQDWERFVELVEDRMLPNRTVVLNVYRAFKRSYVHYHFVAAVRPMMEAAVEEQAKNCRVTEEQRRFLADLLSTCLVDVFLTWLDNGMPTRTVDHLDDFRVIADGCMEHILLRLEKKNLE